MQIFVHLQQVGRSVALQKWGEESPDRREQGSVEITAGGNFRQIVTEKNRPHSRVRVKMRGKSPQPVVVTLSGYEQPPARPSIPAVKDCSFVVGG